MSPLQTTMPYRARQAAPLRQCNMTCNPDIHNRRSIRLKDYDYSQAGAYFVTICTKDKECLFGNIIEGKMQCNNYAERAVEYWQTIPRHFSDTGIDEFVFMPNHMHGIIFIYQNDCRGEVSSPIPTKISTIKGGETPPLQKPTSGQIVAYFKYLSTKSINIIRNTPSVPLWQRNYYEHIMRDEPELNKIREYISNNPLNWKHDENYSD